MNPNQSGPTPRKQGANGDEHNEAEVNDHDGVGEDSVRHETSPRERTVGHGGGRVAVALVVVAYAWWAVSRPPFSETATVAVMGAGAVATLWGVLGARSPAQRPETGRDWRWWAVLAVVTAIWQGASYVQHPRAAHPTISSLTNEVLDTLWARAAAFVLWVLTTVGIARR